MSVPAYAKENLQTNFQEVADWGSFDRLMKAANERDQQIGWSYLISGILVGIGGTIGSQNATDTGSKLVYTISAGFGLGAASYGILRLTNGNEYMPFYNTLLRSSLTPLQRDELVKRYIEQIKEREKMVRITRIISYATIGALSFYSASKEEDKNTKTFFQLLGTVNIALALTYTF